MKPVLEDSVKTTLTHPMTPSAFRVQKVQRETLDTFTLELRPEEKADRLAFAAGQFNMMYVFGIGEIPVSIAGDPGNSDSLIHTTRSVGAVSGALCRLKRGDTIGIRGPFGSHWPMEEAVGKDIIIVAGGIGLAPLRSVIYQILADRTKYGKVALLYGARTPGDILYQSELEQWRSRLDIRVEVTVDRAPNTWRGMVGVVTTLISKASFDPNQSVAMICGPEVMMRFTAFELERHKLGTKQIYISMERNMKCGVGFCGHCQFGPQFVCKEGPIFRYDRIAPFLAVREF